MDRNTRLDVKITLTKVEMARDRCGNLKGLCNDRTVFGLCRKANCSHNAVCLESMRWIGAQCEGTWERSIGLNAG